LMKEKDTRVAQLEGEKQGEIAVLKEMVKSSQTQLKQKEAELIHMRKKLSYSEA